MYTGIYFIQAKQIKLHYRYWIPVCPQAFMILLHGAGEHSGQYSHIGEECSQRQIAFIAPDVRRFGLSEGQRGHVRCFQDYVDDLELLIVNLQAQYPESPVFLVGYSLGGLIAIRYVQHARKKICGIILISPVFDVHPRIPNVIKKLVCLVSRVMPSTHLELVRWNESLRKLKWLQSRLPDWTSDLLNDRLATNAYTPRWIRELIHSGSKALSQSNQFLSPTLCIYDRHDPIVNSDRIRQFFENIVSDDKESKVYAKGKHQFLNDKDVVQHIFQWLSSHL